MRPILLTFLLLAPALAGCFVDQLRGLEPAPPEPRVLPWGLSDCTFVIAVVPVPAARLAPLVPEGFRVLSVNEAAGAPNDARGDGNVGVEAWRCAEGVGLNETHLLPDVPYGAVFSFVEPPADLAVNGSTYHFLKWDVLVNDLDRRVVLTDHGVPAQGGNVTFRRFQPVPGGGFLLDVELELNGTATFRGGASVPEPSFQALSFTEYTPTPLGLARWTTNASAPDARTGSGTLAVTGGFLRDVIGSAQTQAYFIAGTGGAFTNGTIVLPPRPIE